MVTEKTEMHEAKKKEKMLIQAEVRSVAKEMCRQVSQPRRKVELMA